jgi:hypothetical protein
VLLSKLYGATTTPKERKQAEQLLA